ncbi:MAG: glycosyltransferase family 4 protein [Bacteroidales bacterium]|nr:glycosyltransferase family 4 protein [Bacteroidales bacterium]
MKVVLINTSDSGGGAAIACKRLMEALTLEGIDVRMLVMTKKSQIVQIQAFKKSKYNKYASLFRFMYERLSFVFHEKDKSVRFAFSPANIGVDISNHPWIKEADIVHIHWINGGFLSLKSLNKLLEKKKNHVFTFHDMWLFTGGCHYAGDCINYETQCHHCPFLKRPSENDLSSKVWNKKASLFKEKKLNIVCCSEWLAKTARKSSLLQDANIQNIPNPISLIEFKPKDKTEIREKLQIPTKDFVLLFGAANINDKRKGFVYLLDALKILKEKNQIKTKLTIAVFGKAKDFDPNQIPFPVINLGQISSLEKMAEVYAMADLFILPSLEDNLPNTVMESLACGTPVVAFNIGGIPEMVEHEKTGIIVDKVSAETLANGILKAIQSPNISQWSSNARRKVEEEYNQQAVAQKYIKVYNNIIETHEA